MYCLVWQRFWPVEVPPVRRASRGKQLNLDVLARVESGHIERCLERGDLGDGGKPDFALLLAAGHSLRNARARPCRILRSSSASLSSWESDVAGAASVTASAFEGGGSSTRPFQTSTTLV